MKIRAWTCWCFIPLTFNLPAKDTPDSGNKRQPEFHIQLEAGYNGANHRTGMWEWSAAAGSGVDDQWSIEGGARTYSDLRHSQLLLDQAQAYTSFSRMLWIDDDEQLYLDLLLDIAGPSSLTFRGFEFSPGIKLLFKANDEVSIGLAAGAVLGTSPDPGDRAGYIFAEIWTTWETRWLKNQSDQITLSVYSSTHERPGYRMARSAEAAYGFDINDSCSVQIGIGTELSTPYERQAFYFLGSLGWRF